MGMAKLTRKTGGERPFVMYKPEYITSSLKDMAPEDKQIALKFIASLKTSDEKGKKRGISAGRERGIANNLAALKKSCPKHFTEYTLEDIEKCIGKFSREHKESTTNTMISTTKQFVKWMVINGYSTISRDAMTDSNELKKYTVTTPVTAGDLLTESDIKKMIGACSSSRDRALVTFVYESGCRIHEAAKLRWREITFDDHGVKAHLSGKGSKERYTRLVFSKPYLAEWKSNYPGNPDGDSLVFVTLQGKPMIYETCRVQMQRIADRAGIGKPVRCHLLRHSRATHLMNQHVPPSVIKKMLWGNLNSKMLEANYGHLADSDVDREILSASGVKVEQKKEISPLEPVQCPSCYEINKPGAVYCCGCGKPITEQEQQKQTDVMDQLLALLKKLPAEKQAELAKRL